MGAVLPLLISLLACSEDGAPDSAGGASDAGGVEDGGAGGDGGVEDGGTDDGGTQDGGSGDTGSGFCDDAPTVTWASFGRGFLLEACQGCHASTAPDRHGAPDEVVFDTVDDAWFWAPYVLAMAAYEPIEMPPMGGTTEDDRTRLRWWLECGTPGT